jgi:predicted nicotinamide N-methyase
VKPPGELASSTFVAGSRLPIPLDLRGFASRPVEIELSGALSFQMLEVLGQRRPSQWAHVWPTAVAMSRWLLEQPAWAWPARARELGCGVGLVGMTLAHCGVQVEGTDREPTALAFAARNALRNGLTGYTVRELEWSEPRGDPTPLLLASDVLYEPGAAATLYALIRSGLMPFGRLIVAGPVARPAPLDELVARLVKVGFRHDSLEREIDWQGRREAVSIHVLGRPD